MSTERKARKERQYLFGVTRIANVSAAQEMLETSVIDIKKAKKGLLISFLAVIFLIAASFCKDSSTALSIVLLLAYVITTFCAYSAGGGFKKALAIGGELVDLVTLPFIFLTWSLILDFLLEAIIWVMTFICILLFPYFFLLLMLLKGRKEQKAAQKYLTEHAN